MTYCSYPARNHGDGRGCQMDDCPRHGGNDDGPDGLDEFLAAELAEPLWRHVLSEDSPGDLG